MADFVNLQKFTDVELTEYEREIIETIYPEMWGFEGKNCPTTGDLRLGLKKLVYARVDRVGKAVNYGGTATSIPLSNFGITLEEHKTAVGIAAAEWGVFDIEAEKVAAEFPQLFQSRDLIRNYREALEKSLREWMHKKALFGDQELGMAGLFSGADVGTTLLNVPLQHYAQAAGNTTTVLHDVAPQELYDFMLERLKDFKKRTLLTSAATHLLCTSDLYTALNRRFRDGGTDGSPMALLGRSFASITEVNELSYEFLNENGITVRTAPGATGNDLRKDRFIIYENSPKVLMRRFHPIETTAPKLNDDQMTFRIIGYCATSEVCVKQPMRIRYYDYPAAPARLASSDLDNTLTAA